MDFVNVLQLCEIIDLQKPLRRRWSKGEREKKFLEWFFVVFMCGKEGHNEVLINLFLNFSIKLGGLVIGKVDWLDPINNY